MMGYLHWLCLEVTRLLVPIVPDGNAYLSKIDSKNQLNISMNSHVGTWELGLNKSMGTKVKERANKYGKK